MANPLKVNKKTEKVIIHTLHHRVEGEIHVYPGSRITDFLNNKNGQSFVAVTNAKVYLRGDSSLLYKTDFLNLHKDHITMVLEESSIDKMGSHQT